MPAKPKKGGRTAPLTMADVEPDLIPEVEERWSKLDESDYFQALRVEYTAAPADIKSAYYAESRKYHPDLFYKLDHAEFKDKVNDIYKRVNEAYVILRDDRKREQYLSDIAGSDRAQKLRFTEVSEAEAKMAAKREVEEQIGTTPQGRKFFEQGMRDHEAGNFPAAERNFKMALTFEPQNAKYKEMFNDAVKRIKMDFKIK